MDMDRRQFFRVSEAWLVGCGIIMYSLGDRAKNVSADIIHIVGDPDHPVNRGTLCPKGAGPLDFVHSPNRLKHPEIREPGSKEWKRVSWDDALTRLVQAEPLALAAMRVPWWPASSTTSRSDRTRSRTKPERRLR